MTPSRTGSLAGLLALNCTSVKFCSLLVSNSNFIESASRSIICLKVGFPRHEKRPAFVSFFNVRFANLVTSRCAAGSRICSLCSNETI